MQLTILLTMTTLHCSVRSSQFGFFTLLISLLLAGQTVAQAPRPSNLQEINAPAPDLGAAIATACKTAGPAGQIKINVRGGVISTPAFPSCGAATVVEFGPGVFTFTGAGASNTISVNALKILGAGRGATIFDIDSPTSNLFTVEGKYFELGKIHFRPKQGVARTAGHIVVAHNSHGEVHDVLLIDPWNGFLLEGPLSGPWSFDNVMVNTSGGNWNYLFRTISTTGTSTSFNIQNVSGDLAHGHQFGPLMVFDSRTDTVAASNINIVGAGGQPIVRCQDSLNAGKGQWPRWIHFTNAFLEAPNSTVIDIESARDFSYQNSYVSGANIGIAVGPAAYDTKIVGDVFPGLAQQAITIAAGSRATVIQGNTFDSVGSSGNGRFPLIDVAADASDFIITGNQSFSFYGPNQWPSYGASIAPGRSSRFAITNNNFQQTKSEAVHNAAEPNAEFSISGNSGVKR